ncbi:predicted protein [Methanosarcina acetivorans C2A]|uniref:Uncharacterized protein n=1 Tax=Methanosarcina acetivorans (strain ATCC 35395 / DSM 2834 / JCM 12185 / C2A) TaxID=188937 RepID=Q8TLW0_METAC|nr:predicted protein [Methanosarcina acetivorans C2A]
MQPYSKCNRTQNATVLKMQPYSKCNRTQNATVLKMQPYSKCNRTQNAAVLKMQPYSKCNRTQNATILHSSEHFARSAEFQHEGKNLEIFLKSKCSLPNPDDYRNEKIN